MLVRVNLYLVWSHLIMLVIIQWSLGVVGVIVGVGGIICEVRSVIARIIRGLMVISGFVHGYMCWMGLWRVLGFGNREVRVAAVIIKLHHQLRLCYRLLGSRSALVILRTRKSSIWRLRTSSGPTWIRSRFLLTGYLSRITPVTQF